MGKGDKSIRTLALGVARVAAAIAAATPAQASEGGASFYLLGSGGPGAAELPPVTGLFFDNTLYYYTAQSSGSREFVVGGNVVAGLELDLVADFATVMWVPSTDVLGGTLAVGGAFAVGRPEVGVDAILTGPRGNSVALHVDDSATIIGDPVVLGELSWKVAPKLHAAVAGTLNIPVGHYREGELANVSFHRWIFDASAALTWKDEETGWDVSGKAGLTFNPAASLEVLGTAHAWARRSSASRSSCKLHTSALSALLAARPLAGRVFATMAISATGIASCGRRRRPGLVHYWTGAVSASGLAATCLGPSRAWPG